MLGTNISIMRMVYVLTSVWYLVQLSVQTTHSVAVEMESAYMIPWSVMKLTTVMMALTNSIVVSFPFFSSLFDLFSITLVQVAN